MAEKVQALLWCDPARRPRPAHAMARAAGEQHLAPSHLQLAAARRGRSVRTACVGPSAIAREIGHCPSAANCALLGCSPGVMGTTHGSVNLH